MAKDKAVKSKKKPLIVIPKPTNPARKFMSKKEAVEDNRLMRERKAKLKDYKEQLEAEDAGKAAPAEETKRRGRQKKTEE